MRPGPSTIPALSVLAVLAASCSGGASPDIGIEATLRLSGTGVQYVPGPLVDDSAAVGPAVHNVSAAFHIFPGVVGRSIGGSAQMGTASVLVGLDGDIGHYIVPISGPDIDNPPDLLFSATASFAQTLTPGTATIRARAVGADGTIGPGAIQTLQVDATAVTGALVISLSWDTEADLDLHVLTAATTSDGKPIELWSGNRTTLPARSPLEGGAYSDAELAMAGILDFDSNSQCQIDGQRLENVFWTVPPPVGHYIVRVDTFSMCGQPAARWGLTAVLNGESLGTFAGETTDSDTRFRHGAGAGLDVLEFDVM